MGIVDDGEVNPCHFLSFCRKQANFNKEAGLVGEEAEMTIARLIDNKYIPGDPYPGSVKH